MKKTNLIIVLAVAAMMQSCGEKKEVVPDCNGQGGSWDDTDCYDGKDTVIVVQSVPQTYHNSCYGDW